MALKEDVLVNALTLLSLKRRRQGLVVRIKVEVGASLHNGHGRGSFFNTCVFWPPQLRHCFHLRVKVDALRKERKWKLKEAIMKLNEWKLMNLLHVEDIKMPERRKKENKADDDVNATYEIRMPTECNQARSWAGALGACASPLIRLRHLYLRHKVFLKLYSEINLFDCTLVFWFVCSFHKDRLRNWCTKNN